MLFTSTPISILLARIYFCEKNELVSNEMQGRIGFKQNVEHYTFSCLKSTYLIFSEAEHQSS